MSAQIEISTVDLGKKYRKNWLFKNLDLSFSQGQAWAILGRNGSGKSTLLKILCGAIVPTKGKVTWLKEQSEIELKDQYQFYSITAPYLELVEEFTLREMLDFHFSLKQMIDRYSVDTVIENAGLSLSADVKVKYFSSGMLQRLKLITCLFSDVPVLLLDEPCTNLDEDGIAWYRKTIEEVKQDRLIIVASNQAHEYDFCSNLIRIDNLVKEIKQ